VKAGKNGFQGVRGGGYSREGATVAFDLTRKETQSVLPNGQLRKRVCFKSNQKHTNEQLQAGAATKRTKRTNSRRPERRETVQRGMELSTLCCQRATLKNKQKQ